MILAAGVVGPDAAVVPTQISAAMVCGYLLYLLQKLKSVPWMSVQTEKLNAIIRVVLSGVATLGITIAWNGDAHQLVIGNLYATTILAGFWHWFTQYAATHGFEKILSGTVQGGSNKG